MPDSRDRLSTPCVQSGNMISQIAYYRRLWQLYRSYRRRDAVVRFPPVRLWIELSARCNLRCVMCPNRDLPEDQKGDMEWPVFRKVVDEAEAFAFEISLHHRGESLLHPRALEFIRYAGSKRIRTKLHTNGSLLTPELAEGIVDSGLSRISFSLDGFTREEYGKIRRGGDFDRVVANISGLLRAKKKAGANVPAVAIEVIELPGSRTSGREKEMLLHEFRKAGLDELVVKKPHNWAGYWKSGRGSMTYAPCTFPWNALLVLWNGDVSPCSQDFFGTCILGNVKEKQLTEIWNDGPMQRLRAGLGERRFEEFPACTGCDRLWRNTFLGIPREYLRRLIFRRLP